MEGFGQAKHVVLSEVSQMREKTGERVIVTKQDGTKEIVEGAIRVHTAGFRADLHPTQSQMEERIADGPNFRPHVIHHAFVGLEPEASGAAETFRRTRVNLAVTEGMAGKNGFGNFLEHAVVEPKGNPGGSFIALNPHNSCTRGLIIVKIKGRDHAVMQRESRSKRTDVSPIWQLCAGGGPEPKPSATFRSEALDEAGCQVVAATRVYELGFGEGVRQQLGFYVEDGFIRQRVHLFVGVGFQEKEGHTYMEEGISGIRFIPLAKWVNQALDEIYEDPYCQKIAARLMLDGDGQLAGIRGYHVAQMMF